MAGENNQNNQNEDLNDAVEQTDTNDAGTPSQQQNQQNQQNTIASTIATGAENTDAADEVNQALDDNPSGAGNAEDTSASGAAVQEETPESDGDSDAAQSNVVGGAASEAGSDNAAGSGGGAGAGAQAVGGDNAQAATGGTDAEGNEEQGQAARTSAAPSTTSSESGDQQVGDELDSQTVEETFAVDVQASDEETISEVDDDFDSETVSETFKIKVESENDAPEAEQDLAYIMDEDGSITFTQEQLLEYASDVDGDELVASNVQVGADATVQDNGDGTFTVVPSADFNGELDLTFDISDGQETISSAIDLTVRPINDAPVPEDKTFEIEEDGTLVFTDADLLSGATDIEGDNLTVEGVTYDGGDGILTDNGNGTYTFAPNENFNGDVNFGFDVSDGTDTVSANIDVSVTAVDDAPVSGDLAYSIDEDGSIRLSQEQLLSQASDVEGDDLTASSLTVDGDATVVANDDGSFTITPDENFNGDIDISFDISDGTNTVQASADLTVNPVNDLPVPQDQQFSVEEDGTLIFTDADLLTGATDIEGDNQTVEGVTYDGGDGILTDNGNGTYTFAPNENFNGDVNFGFDVSDGTDTVSANIDVSVTAVDDAPVSGDLAYSIDEDGSIRLSQEQLLLQASDVEGDDLTASDLTVDGDATVVANDDGSFTITPDENFNGDIDISFDISDGTNTVQASADLTVNPVNDLPVPQDQQFSVEEDGTLIFTDADLLTGATDIDGDDLTVEGISYTGGDGVLTDHGDGTYTFAPNENFNGDVNFSFDVSDGTETVSANIDVSVTPENDPPVAGSTSYMVNEDNAITISDEQLLANSSDVEGAVSVDTVTYSGTDGVFQDNGDGSYTFLPNENFSGDISLDVIVADEEGAIDETTAGITVLEVNDPPVAGPTSYTIDEDSVLTFSESQILVNASDVEGDVELVGINYDGSDGIFTVNGDGTCSFAPNENFNGQVQLDVTIQDESGATVETHINVDVLPINDAPVSGDLAYTINEDSSITLTQDQLLARAGDIDSENLEAINLSTDENATIQQNEDGSYTITPDADYNGDLDLSFDIIDNDGGEVQVGLDITVNPLNDLPQAQDQQFTIEEDGTLLFTDEDLLAGASDIDGDELSIENVLYTGADGVLSDNGDGTYSFAPNENFNGDVQFSFDVSDGTGSTAAVIDVSVTPENDPPVAGSTSYTVQEDGQITISDEQLLANSSDVEGDVSLSGVTYSGDDGSFVDNGNGTYTFTPNENFDGDISLDVVVVDEDGATATATATAGIDVIAVNDGPETSGIQAEVDEDNAITITQEHLLANATDVEGDDLVASNLQTNDPDATIVENEDGSFTITHTENFNGELDFTYSISDGENAVLTTLDLTVNPVNDAPEAGEEIFIQAEEDQTVGVTLREEPALRLDQAPENGIIEANLDDEWVVLEVGQEVPADTEVRFVPSEEALANGTHTTQIGTFDDNASVDDWGTEVDPYTREFSDGDLTVTVQSNDDPLGAWNGNTHIGHGIGDTDRQGLSGDEKLTISVEGQDINEISFHLDGLGGWFMEESRHFTEVEIKAFNEDGDLIDSMTYHKEDRGTFETDYTLTVDQPVSYFELGTVQGNGTYVVQNMTVSQTCHDEAVFTSIGVDGSEITETVELNIHAGDNEIELTAELPNITVDTDGSAQFASVVITEEQLLAQASDIDGDDLDIQNLELVGENSEHATLTDNGDGTWTVTPDENFHGEIELGYQVTDGELTDSNIININFESVNDAPIVSGPIVLSTEEDEGITFSADDLLANTTDVEGDTLSISDITYGGDNGELVDNGDGTFTFMPNENFNGEIDIDYKVFDGTDEVATHLDLTVIPVNDVPVPGAPLHTQMLENGSMIIEAKDLLSGATDVDGDILHVENLLLADQAQGTLTDNGDNTFTFEPAENFYGDVNLTFNISDGQASALSTARVEVEIVNEGPEVSGPIEAAVDEDGSITITQEDLLANATDVDGDNLEAVNLATNDPNAVIVENSNSSFTITPSADFFGEIEFTYDVTDAIETVAADLNLTVNPINDAPDVPDMSFTTEDGQAITITEAELLAQATDVEGDELSVVNVTSASDTIEVTDNGDGTYTLTPELGFFGNVDLAFDVSDGTDVVAANIDLKVEFVNDAPEAAPIVTDVDEDGSILVTQEMLLENANDQDGDELFATSLETNDLNASIVDNGDGTYTVTPSENFNGDIAFTYEVSDGELSMSNDMILTVNPVNDIPIVAPGMYHIEEDGSILFTQEDLLSGAIDIDGDDLSVTSINYSGDEGTVTDNGDGTFSFVPEDHFSGDLEFSYTVTDGTDEVEQDINVHIEAVADAPDLVITDGDGVNVDDEAILVEPGGIVELNIAAALVDQDLSEALTVTVDGVPEGSVIQYDNEGVLNDQENGITSYNDTEITVTFEGETAGYQNAAGYYKVDEDGNITGVEVVYENASQVGGGGDLVPGQDQFSFQVAEGESFNLFLVPNGHQHNDFDSMQDGQYEFRAEDGSPANMDTVDPQLVFVAADGTETVVQGQNGDAIFHGGSSSQLNQDGIEHTRTTVNEDGELVYGFEDLYGGGDADYTDFNFTIDVGEVNSQIYSGEITVGPDGAVNLPITAIENELQLQLPEDFNQQLEVHVTATATELSNDDSEVVSQTIYINATGVTVDHAPEALPVAATVQEDGSIVISQEDLLANASDLDGDQLTAINLATDDDSVTITDNGDGTYTLIPDADFNGDVSFTFDVSDGDDVVSTNLELTVSPVNDGPEVQDQTFTVGEDGVLTFNDQDLLTGAMDIEGDDLSVEGVTYTGADGVLTDNGDGTYSFAPNENFNGDVNFSFNVSDGTDTVTANIDVSVTPENDPPVAGSTSYTVHEDNAITISNEQLLANSSDIEGEVAIDSVTYSGSNGVLEINGDGTYTFSPNENFNGEVSLDVIVVDEDDAAVSTTADITVLEVNDPPVAGPTSYTIDEDSVLTFSESQVLLNASDIEGDVELVEINYDGPDGIFSINGDGTCSFAPNENFNGQVLLDVTIQDEDGAQVDTFITVDVLPINDVPVSGDLAYSVEEDGSITLSQEQLLSQASDVDGDDLIASNLIVDGDATVVANDDGSFTITPDVNFNGDIDLTFDISDGTDTLVATADLTVNPVNDLPQPQDQTFSIGEDGTLNFTDEDLLTGAADIDGEDLSVEGVTYTGADGVLTDNGDGSYSFAPNENFNGDVNFSFDVSDGTDTVQANIDISVTPENDPPVAGSTSYTVHEDNSITISNEQLLANSSDVEGEVAIDSVNYTGADGIFTDNGDGTFSFAPNANFDGDVSLDVVVTDEDGATTATTASIDVLPINDPPVSGDLAYSIDEDGSITLTQEQLLSQASDVDGDDLTASNLSAGDNATVVDNGDGTFTVTPDANFNGDIDLSFDISDGTESIVANADLTVNPVNDLPTTSDVYANVDEDNVITITQEQLLANAADIEGDDLVASDLTLVGDDATIVDNGDGTFSITPSENFNGYIDVAYSISDGDTPIAANLGLTVDPVNDAPIVSADVAITIEEDGSYTITQEELLQFATDIEDDDMTAIIGEQGDETTVTGTVLDAETSNPVSGAEVTLTDSAGNSYTTVTDDSGNYSVTGSVVDQGTVTIEQEGSITSSFLVPAGEDVNGGVTAISEVLEETDMRIVVTWGESPRDMDNHLWLYDTENGNELDHIYYRDMSHDLGEGNVVQQDVDDTNGGGPETITIPNYQDADMHYSVHNYTNRSWDVDGVEDVQVQVFVGDTLVETFSPDLSDTPSGDHWHVFDIVNGIIVPSQDVGTQNAFDLPTAEEALANENGIDISELLTGDEGDDSGDTGGNEPSVGDVSIENALITDNGDGTYTITPEENFNGEFSISYNVDDGNGGVTPAELDVTVTAVNDLSVIYDHDYTINEDGSLTFTDEQLLAGATDIDGDDLSVESVNYEGTDGVFTDNGDGTYTFAPNENFNGNVDLTYDVSDGTDVVSANIDVQVVPINDVPVAGSTTYSVEEDGSITLSDAQLLANSSDVEGEVFVSDVSYSGTDGVFTDNGDGTYTFAPNENFNGDISLDVSVMDEDGATAETTAGIDVIAVNDLPVAGSTTYSVDEDNVITISEAQLLANSSDIEGDVSVSDVSYSGADGIFTDNGDGTYSFAPNENFNGNVSLDVTVADEDGATAQTTAGIDVIAVNDAPVSGDLAYSVDEDGSITLSQEQLLAQASDVDGDDLTAANLTAGDNATVTANDDGSFTITPDADFNGDIGLSFDLSDGTETVVATADLTVNPVNDIAVVENVAYTIEEDGSVTFTDEQLLAGASDIDGDELSVADVSYTGAEGVFTDNGDGTYSFAPNENFNGDVSLDFLVSDGTEMVDANIDVTVTDVNDAPVAGATSYQMNEDGTITISPEQLIANSSDVDGEVSLESVTYSGSDGTLVQNDNGSVTFTPNENFNGDISLDVVVTDDDGATATTTAGIEVLAVNDGPESEDVNLTTAEDSTILITQDMLLAQATDIDNTADELSASGLQIDPILGELLDNEDGTWSFTPNENFNGDVPMTFNVSDGQETIAVDGNIDVTPVNDAPDAPTIEMQGEEDVVMVIDPAYIAGQVTDLDGDEISIESITVRAPANATLTQQPDGMYHLVTTQDFNGLVELGYQATDGEEVVDGSLNVDVIPVNDAPFNVGNAMMTTNEDGAFTFDAGDLMNLFGDIDTADLVVSRIITAEGEDGGEVTDNGDGTWTFTPTGDFSGVSDLQVVVSDGEFETVLDVPVFVRPVADGAVITTDHDGPLVFGEDETGHLGLNVGLVDDSETLSNLVMTGFPVGFEVTDGVNTVMITEPGQYIDLFDWDISNIQMTPPEDFHGEFFVTVSATTVDYGDEPEAFDDGIDTGDFETVAGDSIILTADDLIGLAENVDADSDDEVKLVHLADRSQGEIVDNGDGTWTFTPAPGFTGEADIAYVVDKDGVLHDEQTGVVVKEGDSQENAAPEVNSITTTEIAADATLSFTDEDMLANLSDAEGDSLSIESVSLMEGQGVIESDNQGNYQFTPAEDYTGDVQVGFIATDGENRIESFFNVDIQGGDEAASSEGYTLADDGSLTITDAQLVDELGVSDSAQVVDVADANDAGFFAQSGEGEWTYWPNEDFDGNLAMNVEVNDGGEVSSHSLSIQVEDDSVQSDEPQVQAAQETEERQVEVAQQADDQAQDAETEDSTADVTAAPGDTISISIPDEVSGNESVDYADMSGLPEGATVSNALDNGDGSFTISGNLEQPVSVELPEGYEGTSEIQFQGYDELGSSIDGASGSVEVEVDDQYTMQGSTQEQQPDMAGMESGGSDWTSSGDQDQGVDFTDDSGSFDSDSQTGTDQGNDFDQSSI
ncbi:tandem-95 repeat protein [Vibrio splendidus]|uniref:tandem-95 repeat protein n=1 Tax=Vibrio splendidus TaxID=29497 RepID=UPI00076A457B|nr:tandem-95 repeat protein [Vibrio splendidus]